MPDLAGPVGVAPNLARRSLLILLEKMAPYLAEHLSHAASSAASSSVSPSPDVAVANALGRGTADPRLAAPGGAAQGRPHLAAGASDLHHPGAAAPRPGLLMFL